MDPITLAMLGSTAIKGITGFLGNKSAEKKAAAAAAAAQARTDAEMARARGDVNTGFDRATGAVDPWVKSGTSADALHSNALGINGREAQQGFFADFETDPGFQATLDAGRRQIEHANILKGTEVSGGAMKELHQFGQREMQGQFKDRLDRLAGVSTRGLSAAGTQGTFEATRGTTLADIALKAAGFGRDTELTKGAIAAGSAANRYKIAGDTLGGMVSAFGNKTPLKPHEDPKTWAAGTTVWGA